MCTVNAILYNRLLFPIAAAIIDGMAAPRLMPHPDRLLPSDPTVRPIARALYDVVRELPIISPHGHVEARMLHADEPFTDPVALLITPDHYVTRLLHASGVPLDMLGVGRDRLSESDARAAWGIFCSRWGLFRGTSVRYWMESELADLFGVTEQPTTENADALYDQIAGCLDESAFRPRALLRRFGIDVLATTDDPSDPLTAHAALATDATLTTRVIPTFRPDTYLEPTGPNWRTAVEQLGAAANVDTGTYEGFCQALEDRRRHFLHHGAVSTDHGHLDPGAAELAPDEAARIYRLGLQAALTEEEGTRFRRHMIFKMAGMSSEDGLVMTMHPGALRGHHVPTDRRFGPNVGADIPVATEYTRSLRPLLERYGNHPQFHLVLFTLDETVWSRELAPLAGFYSAVYVGAPWWFLDEPDTIRRFRAAVTGTIGFSRTSGFIDDTRAFCSIPARHDMARRLDCGYLARLVAEHVLDEEEAFQLAVELVTVVPRRVFKL